MYGASEGLRTLVLERVPLVSLRPVTCDPDPVSGSPPPTVLCSRSNGWGCHITLLVLEGLYRVVIQRGASEVPSRGWCAYSHADLLGRLVGRFEAGAVEGQWTDARPVLLVQYAQAVGPVVGKSSAT